MSIPRTPLLVTLALVVGSLLAPTAGPTALARATAADGGAAVTVTVPTISYSPRDDRFRIGPYRSRLHVLFNDTGLAAPARLQLLDRRGNVTPTLTVARLARLQVVAGYVVLDPAPGAQGRLSFSYRAASPNGPPTDAHAVVELFRRVVVAASDKVTTRTHRPVEVSVATNDRLLVAGAVTACAPRLFTRAPRRPNPLPLVLPEPARQPIACIDLPRTLTDKHGRWRVDATGRVVFSPAAGFTGTARVYYQQASDHPFDVGVATVSVTVGRRGSAVLGVKVSHGGDGRPGGRLAATGAAAALLILAGGTLVLVGLLLVRAARRRRQPTDLEA